jgi:ppGpp synthetase/RelA/SpoT-type nucleotidyltranferase
MEQNSAPDVVGEFVARFRREFDFYEQAGRIVAQRLEAQLESSGIRAIITSRAKNPKRLEVKARQRHLERNYQNADEIYADIVDLAGVRVSLFFPGEQAEVDKIIREHFQLSEVPKIFTGTSNLTDKKRFSGYWATHYRLHLKEDGLTEQSLRFTDARVEVQVASVLMYAWSEVEHDLVYKPMQGALSEDELAILDELNGMVLTGEIALGRLQRAASARVSSAGSRFENHYDLASFLLELGKSRMETADKEPVVGDVEILFRLLTSLNISTPEMLTPYLQGIKADGEQRPLSQQIVDQIVAAHPDRYSVYAAIRSDSGLADSADVAPSESVATDTSPNSAIGYFMTQWIVFERFLREIATARGLPSNTAMAPTSKLLKSLSVLSEDELLELDRIRNTRNQFVHGMHRRLPSSLLSEGYALARILERLKTNPNAEVAEAMERASSDQPHIDNFHDKINAFDTALPASLQLSTDAIELVRAAASDQQGQILKLAFISGRAIQAGGKQYGSENAKEASRWTAALNELLANKLVEVLGHKGEVFSLTHAGWQMAENLGQSDSS